MSATRAPAPAPPPRVPDVRRCPGSCCTFLCEFDGPSTFSPEHEHKTLEAVVTGDWLRPPATAPLPRLLNARRDRSRAFGSRVFQLRPNPRTGRDVWSDT